ncbi:hypothetical protein psal_cds_353 [Pandoravirus salinus]|uniref:Uncharacterized protein n=1 Tax=Pandoravirus salinus TaxID=1349410 RepID=A0A291ATF8_9VIRU|nr:hypothetical protein psal_cds_353 [Pandoravirus salinus]ATE82162.1 hypothetical protein psal_cds_353 [Pandoravirus salinus]
MRDCTRRTGLVGKRGQPRGELVVAASACDSVGREPVAGRGRGRRAALEERPARILAAPKGRLVYKGPSRAGSFVDDRLFCQVVVGAQRSEHLAPLARLGAQIHLIHQFLVHRRDRPLNRLRTFYAQCSALFILWVGPIFFLGRSWCVSSWTRARARVRSLVGRLKTSKKSFKKCK